MAGRVSISEYIGLGCLTCQSSTLETQIEPSKWTELSHIGFCKYHVTAGAETDEVEGSVRRLLHAQWIRIFASASGQICYHRVYILPDNAGRGSIARNNKGLRSDIETLMRHIDTSTATWLQQCAKHEPFEPWASSEEGSLFYIFNTLPSPLPEPQVVQDQFSRNAMQRLLDVSHVVPGLKSSLYPYQARSAAMMIQHEITTKTRLDPRFEQRLGPDGLHYYFIPRELTFSKSMPVYESNKAGILAETMGLGKTVICLATILATKCHLPLIPAEYCHDAHARNDTVPTLLNLAVTTAGRHSIPAKAYFDALGRETEQDYSVIQNRINEAPPMYYIPGVAPRNNRRSQTPSPRRMILCSGTIIVVPRNLLNQWRAEINKHVFEGPYGLKVLVLDGNESILPPADQLRHYDLVLFSKSRFQREIKHGSDQLGRNMNNTFLECHCPYIGATRIRDCTCLKESDIYKSPLQELHWLRIIIDEGHEFSSATSDAVLVAQKLVVADRRWIVSGTPARDKLHGIEVENTDWDVSTANEATAVADHGLMTPCSEGGEHVCSEITIQSSREQSLLRRKQFQPQEDVGSSTAARSIGTLVSHFLQIHPWAHQPGEHKADWDEHIYRHEGYRKKTYTSYTACLRRVLESIVIKTRPEDVEKDIMLPPLTHKIVRLQPSFYDKLTANLFVLFLTSNAVCSERSDQDYLFHKNSISARHQLITNLRQSNFFWTGFTVQNVISAVETSLKYLDKAAITCSAEDRHLLNACVEFSKTVLQSQEWLAMSETHEVGLLVKSWPPDSLLNWSLVRNSAAPVFGAGPLRAAQLHVNARLFESDALQGIEEIGNEAMAAVHQENEISHQSKRSKENHDARLGVPASATQAEPAKRTSALFSKHSTKTSPSKGSSMINKEHKKGDVIVRKRKHDEDERELPEDSKLRKITITGTVSAKLSYLLNQIVDLYQNEKIIVFYDGNNAAYYLAQCLEILHIKHLIYAKTLQNEVKSRYIVAFDNDNSIRVLLMDVRAGAYGLNVNKASRVFFINPVCRPSTEAQAIKRAHRIGQTKPVYVETLVLEGSIEESMLERSKSMTQAEHLNVSQLDDDQGIAAIIQNACLMPLTADEMSEETRMAPLQVPIQIFGRKGRGDTLIEGIDDSPRSRKLAKSRARIRLAGNPAEEHHVSQHVDKSADDFANLPLQPSLPTAAEAVNSALSHTTIRHSIFG